MRLLFAVSFGLILSACGGTSGTDPKNGNVSDTHMERGSQRAEDLADAKTFIRTHLKSTTYNSSETKNGVRSDFMRTELQSNLVLDQRWTWDSVSDDFGTGSGMTLTSHSELSYSVDPSQLSLPVKVSESGGLGNVELECAVGSCIAVTGTIDTKIDPPLTPNQGPKPQNSTIDTVVWSFQSREEAERVAKAVTLLLEAAGAKPRKF